MLNLDQGTIIYGLRSQKYPDSHCYGIIVTASCDIANDKVSKFYYLLGIDASEWICSEIGYQQAYAEKIHNLCSKFSQEAEKHSLSADLLLNFSEEEVEQIILSEIDKKGQQDSFREMYNQMRVFCCANMTVDMRKRAIRTDTKPAQRFIKRVGKGELVHFYYLPETSYCDNGKCDKGLIVDLQEIAALTPQDVKQIVSPGIDYLLLPQLEESDQQRLKTQFWLESSDDFVVVDNKITSPWREHLMQRFSFGFVRIGLDGATDSDYETLIQRV